MFSLSTLKRMSIFFNLDRCDEDLDMQSCVPIASYKHARSIGISLYVCCFISSCVN